MSQLAKQQSSTALSRPHDTGYFTREQIETIKAVICPGITDTELMLVEHYSKQTGLSPLTKQLHVTKRPTWDNETRSMVSKLTIQTGIDGYRLIAERTGKYLGQRPFEWCGPDGQWRDIWLADAPPAAARATVLKAGCEPFVVTARWKSYVQTKKDGSPNSMWAKMGAEQLAKCAEALALRKAFPQEMQGVYTEEEMAQAENTREPVRAEVLEPPARAPQLPASTPAAANTSGVVNVRPLPTHTSNNYVVKECQNKPFTELLDAELACYIEHYTKKINDPALQANHREMARGHVLAAEREMEQRLEMDQALAEDPGDALDEPPADEPALSVVKAAEEAYGTTGDLDMVEYVVPDTGEVRSVPADSIEGQLALSLAAKGIDRTDSSPAWGLDDGMPTTAKEKPRTRRSAS